MRKTSLGLLMRKLILYSLFFSCYILFSIAYISQQDLSWNIEITMCLQSILQVNYYNEYKTNMIFISLTLLKNKAKPITHIHLLLSNLLKLTKHKQSVSVFFLSHVFCWQATYSCYKEKFNYFTIYLDTQFYKESKNNHKPKLLNMKNSQLYF